MEDNKYDQLKKDVNRMNEEGFVPEGHQLRVYKNADELIEAIRRNEVPGVPWTEEDEERWQAELALENAFNSEEAIELNSGSFEELSNDTQVEWSEEDWDIWRKSWGDLNDDSIIQ